jgi:predicted RecA/RadA family phage recombinase
MAVNFIQEGRILPFAAPSGGVVSGQGFMVGGLFAVAQYTAAETLTVEGAVTGVWSLPKTATKTFAVGALIYWDNTAMSVTSVTAGNFCIGAATVAAASGDATATVRLNGVSVVASA